LAHEELAAQNRRNGPRATAAAAARGAVPPLNLSTTIQDTNKMDAAAPSAAEEMTPCTNTKRCREYQASSAVQQELLLSQAPPAMVSSEFAVLLKELPPIPQEVLDRANTCQSTKALAGEAQDQSSQQLNALHSEVLGLRSRLHDLKDSAKLDCFEHPRSGTTKALVNDSEAEPSTTDPTPTTESPNKRQKRMKVEREKSKKSNAHCTTASHMQCSSIVQVTRNQELQELFKDKENYDSNGKVLKDHKAPGGADAARLRMLAAKNAPFIVKRSYKPAQTYTDGYAMRKLCGVQSIGSGTTQTQGLSTLSPEDLNSDGPKCIAEVDNGSSWHSCQPKVPVQNASSVLASQPHCLQVGMLVQQPAAQPKQNRSLACAASRTPMELEECSLSLNAVLQYSGEGNFKLY